MLFLTNGSKLTFSPANTAPGGTNSIVQVRNSGILLIAAGSVADFQAAVTNSATTNVLTKSGNGTVITSAAPPLWKRARSASPTRVRARTLPELSRLRAARLRRWLTTISGTPMAL